MFQRIKKFKLIIEAASRFGAVAVFLVMFLAFCPVQSLAQNTVPTPTPKSLNPASKTETPLGATATGNTDLNLLPEYKNIFDFLNKGVLQGFLLPLAPIVGVLAIVWGGYQYYFGSFTGKSDGLNAIKAGITGIVVISGYKIIADVTGVTQTGLISDIFKGGGINAAPIIKLIQETFLNGFLYAISSVVAVLAMVYGGYQYITSPLNKEGGLKTIQNAAIGLVVILMASVASKFIEASFKGGTLVKEPFINLVKQLIANFLLPVSSVVTLFFIVIAGYQWITSQGDSRKVEDAKNNLKNAVIGLVIVLASFSVTQLIIYIVTNTNIGK